ncbi:hypothetical protein ACFPOE_22360 [Caenimonas terrae]|uniref:Uncharacterized protein n=1 Tax=Caenimonas terrae TaxID=696074 RepID=A0ABW0NMA2_9BURK
MMRRKAKPLPKATPDIVEEAEFAAPPPILERPDGYYWQGAHAQAEVGPFESYELAQANRDAVGDESESLREAEIGIGMNEWIDAETGQPAEGQSPPHLEEE